MSPLLTSMLVSGLIPGESSTHQYCGDDERSVGQGVRHVVHLVLVGLRQVQPPIGVPHCDLKKTNKCICLLTKNIALVIVNLLETGHGANPGEEEITLYMYNVVLIK